MPYTVSLLPIDLGGFIGVGTSLNGTFTTVSPGPATDTATATAAAPFTLDFVAANPPSGVATLYLANSGPAGDLFRSGLLASVPPSPGTVTAISVPTSLTTVSGAALASTVARSVGTVRLTPPGWLVGVMVAASAGTYIPLGGAITGAVPTLTAANPATGTPGTVTVTVTGFFTFQTYYVFTDTITFTGTLVMTPTPSADAGQPGRILSVPGTMSLTTTTTGPSPTLALAAMYLSLVAPAVGAILQPQVEQAINDAIDATVAPGLASLGYLRSATSVVSARRITVTAGALSLALVLADLLGPAVTPMPGPLHAAIAPAPVRTQQRTYTVTVTNADTGAPVNQANVTLHNFTAQGAAQSVGPVQTGASGTVTLAAALRPQITFRVDPISHDRERVFVPPTLVAAKDGFNPTSVRLLEDPDDQ